MSVYKILLIQQTRFIQTAADSTTMITTHAAQNLFHEYETIRQSVGPLYALEFSLHVPIILCFSYLVLAHPEDIGLVVWGCGSLAWSSLILTNICLMSEDCFDALHALVPSIRYYVFR